MEAVHSSETSVDFGFTTRRHIAGDRTGRRHRSENLESRMSYTGCSSYNSCSVHTHTDGGYNRHGVTSQEITLFLEQCIRRGVLVSLENFGASS
jgi:hypothetical protein